MSLLEQVIFGGFYSNLDAAATRYNSLVGGVGWHATEAYRLKPVASAGDIKSLRVRLDGAPGAGTDYEFTLMVNGAPTALTLTIANVATSGADMVNSVAVVGGDVVSLRCVPTGVPAVRHATWTSVFEGGVSGESIILGGTSTSTLNNGATEYVQVMCASCNPTVTENDFREVAPTAGTIKNLYVVLDVDPGTAPDAYRFTLRKGGANQTLTVTITANDTTGNDLVNSFAVVAGDVLTMVVEPLNGPSAAPYAAWGMTFVASVDGESITMGGSTDNLHNTNTEYNQFTASNTLAWSGTEAQRYELGQTCTLRKLYMLLSAAPGVGNKYDFTIRVAGADSSVVASVSGAATTGNSGVLEDAVALSEYVDLKVDPDSTPDVADAYWGFVCYLAPPVPPPVEVGPFICCPFCHDASTHIWRIGPAGVRGIDDSRRFFCECCGVFFTSGGETFWEAHGRLE